MAQRAAPRFLALMLMTVFLLAVCTDRGQARVLRGCPCGESYVVKEGETLQTISEKCNDPFILEGNPHILDHDDVIPGQLLKMGCSQHKISLCDIAGALPIHLCK